MIISRCSSHYKVVENIFLFRKELCLKVANENNEIKTINIPLRKIILSKSSKIVIDLNERTISEFHYIEKKYRKENIKIIYNEYTKSKSRNCNEKIFNEINTSMVGISVYSDKVILLLNTINDELEEFELNKMTLVEKLDIDNVILDFNELKCYVPYKKSRLNNKKKEKVFSFFC